MIENSQLMSYKKWVQAELNNCIDFWLENGMDLENGGIITSLDKEGKIYSKEKGVWMQGRSAWMFSYLCNVYGKRDELINSAKSCIDFMENYCIDKKTNRMYLAIDENGVPVSQNRQCFSETFYIIANAEYSLATNDEEALQRARNTYERVWQLNNGLVEDPNGKGPKTLIEKIPARALADPMIYLNVTSVMRRCDSKNTSLYNERSQKCINDIIKYHYKPDLKCTLEFVGLDGTFHKSISDGRLVNPGHNIECSWFMLEEANYFNNNEILKYAEQIFNCAIESGLDKENGGLLSFIDCLGEPLDLNDIPFSNYKVWWTHCETLIASLMLFRDTKNEKYLNYFDSIFNYCKQFFSDSIYGEWYEHLNINGQIDGPIYKGGIYKGPFHVPRMLVMVDKILDDLLKS